MKRKLFLGLCVLASVFMAGCTNDDATTNSPVTNFDEMQNVSLSFYDVSMRPIGDGVVQTRADEKSTFAFTRLDVKLISESASYLYRQYYSADNPSEFGKLQIKVPVGSYQMVAIASKYTDADSVDITSASSIIFPSDKLTDMEQAVVPITVKAGETNSVSTTLKRTISKFTIICTDALPKNAENIRFTVEGNCGTSLNPSTGNVLENGGYQRVITSNSKTNVGYIGAAYNIYLLLGSGEEKVTINVAVLDEDGNSLNSWNFKDVGMKQGFVTTYRGALFSKDTSLNFTFDISAMEKSGYDSTF